VDSRPHTSASSISSLDLPIEGGGDHPEVGASSSRDLSARRDDLVSPIPQRQRYTRSMINKSQKLRSDGVTDDPSVHVSVDGTGTNKRKNVSAAVQVREGGNKRRKYR